MSDILVQKLDEIEKMYNDYLDQARNLSEEQFNYKPNQESWSIAQVLHHIWFATDGTYLYINKKLSQNIEFKPSGFVHSIRSFGLNTVLHSSLKLKAPEYIKNNVIKHGTYEQISTLSEKTFQNFRLLLQTFPENLEGKEIFKHPIVGWVNISQALGFLKGHTVHHKMQIEALLKQV